MRRVVVWVLLGSLAVSCSTPPRPKTALPARRAVPLHVVEFSGNRYIVPVRIEEALGVPLMVHGNSRLYLSLTHEVGAVVNHGPVPKAEDYGYSARGKGRVRVARFRIGDETFAGSDSVPVFDFTEDGASPVKGMLGVPFLVASHAAVDFEHDELLFGVVRQPKPDPSLLARGYRWAPIALTGDGRVTITAHFPAIDRAIPITPSTVSTGLSLHLPLFAGKLPMVKAASPDLSPNGTQPDEFHADEVTFEIAGVPMTSPASFENLAEYGKVSEGDLESFGMLGFDWMKAHAAVIDYANRRLYFRP